MSSSLSSVRQSSSEGVATATEGDVVREGVPSALGLPGHLATVSRTGRESRDLVGERMQDTVDEALELTRSTMEHAKDIKVTPLGGDKVKVEYQGQSKILKVSNLTIKGHTLSAEEIEKHMDFVVELVKKAVAVVPGMNIQALKNLQISRQDGDTKRHEKGQVSVKTTSAGEKGDIVGGKVFTKEEAAQTFGSIFQRLEDSAARSFDDLENDWQREELILPEPHSRTATKTHQEPPSPVAREKHKPPAKKSVSHPERPSPLSHTQTQTQSHLADGSKAQPQSLSGTSPSKAIQPTQLERDQATERSPSDSLVSPLTPPGPIKSQPSELGAAKKKPEIVQGLYSDQGRETNLEIDRFSEKAGALKGRHYDVHDPDIDETDSRKHGRFMQMEAIRDEGQSRFSPHALLKELQGIDKGDKRRAKLNQKLEGLINEMPDKTKQKELKKLLKRPDLPAFQKAWSAVVASSNPGSPEHQELQSLDAPVKELLGIMMHPSGLLEGAEAAVAARQKVLDAKMLQLIQEQLATNPNKIRDGQFSMVHFGLMDRASESDLVAMYDMQAAFKGVHGLTIEYSDASPPPTPHIDRDKGKIILPPPPPKDKPKSFTLNAYFINRSPQGSTKIGGIEESMNRDAIDGLRSNPDKRPEQYEFHSSLFFAATGVSGRIGGQRFAASTYNSVGSSIAELIPYGAVSVGGTNVLKDIYVASKVPKYYLRQQRLIEEDQTVQGSDMAANKLAKKMAGVDEIQVKRSLLSDQIETITNLTDVVNAEAMASSKPPADPPPPQAIALQTHSVPLSAATLSLVVPTHASPSLQAKSPHDAVGSAVKTTKTATEALKNVSMAGGVGGVPTPMPIPADIIGLSWKALESETNRSYTRVQFEDRGLVRRLNGVQCPQGTHLSVQIGGKPFDYHANVVKVDGGRECIACQMPHRNADQEIFWKALYDRQTSHILDLTSSKDIERAKNEGGYTADKTTYPTTVQTYGCMQVTPTGQTTDKTTGAITYTFDVVDTSAKEPKPVKISRTRLPEDRPWPDFGVIDVDQLSDLVDHFDTISAKGSPPLVHCRAGVGRTGTVVTCLQLKRMIEQGQIRTDPEGLLADIKKLILKEREQRGEMFVQSPQQFDLVVKYAQKQIAARAQKSSPPAPTLSPHSIVII